MGFGNDKLCEATASEPHLRRSLYINLFDSSMMSEFIRYWCVRSTTAAGWASESLRKSEISRPPLRAALFLTYRWMLSLRLCIERRATYERWKLEVVTY